MNSIRQHLTERRAAGKKSLAVFVTAGDPNLEVLPRILQALQEAGADLIEIGLPFSDPIADGPAIQASSQRALDRGTTLAGVFEALSNVRLDVPVLAMGYYNPVLRWGEERFAQNCKAAGLSGSLISDLTPEESQNWCSCASRHGIETVFLVAPTSTDERIRRAAECSTGFVYAVSATGVTGKAEANLEGVQRTVEAVRALSELPVLVGFGIHSPETAKTFAQEADGVIVGSAIVKMLGKSTDIESSLAETAGFVRELRKALDE